MKLGLGRRRHLLVSRREPVLGTVADLRVVAETAQAASVATTLVFAELDRLESRFSIFAPTSELSRWRRGEIDAPSSELERLLALAASWQSATGGLLNPGVGVLSERWKRAERDQLIPSASEMHDLADTVISPRFVIAADGAVSQTGDCSELTFHALAKGFVVDCAVAAGFTNSVHSLMLNVGGDLLHRGDGDVVVGVENPLRAYDNEKPVSTVCLAQQGMATSGGARRGFGISGQWFSHVIDPRTGWPVDAVASASVAAHDAVTADALATMLSVVAPTDSTDHSVGVSSLVISSRGEQFATPEWRALESRALLTDR